MSTGNRWEPIETVTRELALAVRLVDAYTGQPVPVRQVRAARPRRERAHGRRRNATDVLTVSIRDVDADPITNPSGYLLYFREDFPDNSGEIELLVEGGGRYVDRRVPVDLSDPERDRQTPLEIELGPLPAYQFPTGATLVRGGVFVIDDEVDDTDDIDLREFGEAGVKLNFESFDATSSTTTTGEFVLPLTGITAADVDDGMVQVGGDDPVLRIEPPHEELDDVSIPVEIREGDTQCYQVRFDMSREDPVSYRECGAETWASLP